MVRVGLAVILRMCLAKSGLGLLGLTSRLGNVCTVQVLNSVESSLLKDPLQ